MATKFKAETTQDKVTLPAELGGGAGLYITCTCVNHDHKEALMRDPGEKLSPNRVHALILAAFHPWAGARSTQQLGPWKIEG